MTDFTTPLYAVFLVILVPLYWLLGRKAQNVLLFLASCLFYAGWDWRFLCLLLFSTVVDYNCARLISGGSSAKSRKVFLIISIVINVGALCFFKYFNFFYDSFSVMLANLGLAQLGGFSLRVILPVGISFYTFQSLGYIIDVYRGEIESEKSWLDFAVFVMFFPHMVAGPIMRASDLLTQFRNSRTFNSDQAISGMTRIFWGLFKKLVIANQLSIYVDSVFGQPSLEHLKSGEALFAVIAFSLQIYTDFSAYSDIARGSANLMGFELMVNFNKPYLSTSFQEFWRRWHISLSTWMRDYIYIPLGGNRGTPLRRDLNVFATFLISGLWHGANWTFVAWGGFHGLMNIIEGVFKRNFGTSTRQFSKPVQIAGCFSRWLLVLTLVCVGWSLFRAPSFQFFFSLWGRFFLFNGAGNSGTVAWYCAVFFGILLISYGIETASKEKRFSKSVTQAGLLALPPILASLAWFFAANLKPPFIYFQF